MPSDKTAVMDRSNPCSPAGILYATYKIIGNMLLLYPRGVIVMEVTVVVREICQVQARRPEPSRKIKLPLYLPPFIMGTKLN